MDPVIDPKISSHLNAISLRAQLHESVFQNLVQNLAGDLQWTERPDYSRGDCRICETKAGDWHFVMVDFSIGKQPGHNPWDRGQNLAIVNKALGLAIMDDSPDMHAVAKWLCDRRMYQIIFGTGTGTNRSDSYTGYGKASGIRAVKIEQTKQYTIDSVEKCGDAVRWLTQHIKVLNGAVWAIPATGSYYRFDEVNKIAYHWGNPHEATSGLLTLMGWNVQVPPSHN